MTRLPHPEAVVIFSVTILMALTIPVVAGSSSQPFGTLVYVRSADSAFLDPGFTTITEDLDVAVNVFDCLLQMDENGNVLPGLATSWEHISPTEWVFHLRPGVTFHDGTPLTSEAVVFSISRHRADSPYFYKGRTSSLRLWLGDLFKRVEAVDDLTVKITLERPYSMLLEALASWPIPIVSPSAVRKAGAEFARQPVGTGPFRLVQWIKDSYLILEANGSYWGEGPYLNRIVFKVVPDPSSRLLELVAGSGHLMKSILPDQKPAILRTPTLDLLVKPSSSIGYVAINHTKKPFDDPRVRKALNYAIDKSAIVNNILGGLGVVPNSMLPPWMVGYNPDIQPYPYDPARARQLLVEAGFPNGFDTQLWTFNVERPFIPSVVQVAEKVQQDLVAAGIRAKLSIIDSAVYWRSINTLQGELAMKGWYTPPYPDFLTRVALLGPESATGYPDTPPGRRLVELALKASETFDPKERERTYREIQQIYREDAAIVPLVHAAYAWAVNRQFTGMTISADGLTRFHAVRLAR